MERKEGTIVTYTDIYHSSEARVHVVTALARSVLDICPRLKDLNSCIPVQDQDAFSSGIRNAVWNFMHPGVVRDS
jgi:hypothetical protein